MARYSGPTSNADEGRLLIVVGPVVAWLGLWVALLGWHVDDAGISYAYARSLASGLGFRAHAEAAVTEGFSNPLWTILLAGPAFAGVPAHVASKALQAAFGAATLLLVHHTVRRVGGERGEGAAAALVTGVCAPWAVWTAGGLETALLSLCLTGFVWAVATNQRSAVAGAFAAATALTRPEGPLLAIALLAAGGTLSPWWRGRPRRLAAAMVLAACLGWLAVRGLVFDAWLPTSWEAKVGPSAVARALRGALYGSAFAAEIGFPLLALGWGAAWSITRLAPLARAIALVVAVDTLVVTALGGDWMRHGRLLAHLVPLVAMASVPGLLALLFRPTDVGRRALVGGARHLASAFFVVWCGIQILFWQDALTHPPLPMHVAHETTGLMADLGPALCGEAPPRFAIPDVGAALYMSPDAVVLDLGGLTDVRDAGRRAGDWGPRLAEARPQIVLVHGTWVPRTGLDDGALATSGFRLLCRREGTPGPSEDRFPPSLYRRGDCAADPGPALLERLDAWCRRYR